MCLCNVSFVGFVSVYVCAFRLFGFLVLRGFVPGILGLSSVMLLFTADFR